MKRYISFSGGVESTTMCLLFGNKADAIFCDTGFEHELLYQRIEQVEQAVRTFHGNNFKVIRVRNEQHGSLKDYIKKSKYYPSGMSRFCTRMFKIEPIDAFLKDQGEVELMIGLNYDEQERVGNHGLIPTVTYSYPLIDLKINRAKCEQILATANLHPKFPYPEKQIFTNCGVFCHR